MRVPLMLLALAATATLAGSTALSRGSTALPGSADPALTLPTAVAGASLHLNRIDPRFLPDNALIVQIGHRLGVNRADIYSVGSVYEYDGTGQRTTVGIYEMAYRGATEDALRAAWQDLGPGAAAASATAQVVGHKAVVFLSRPDEPSVIYGYVHGTVLYTVQTEDPGWAAAALEALP